MQTTIWPTAWKIEETKMIPKKPSPQVVKDLRPVCLTPLWSKMLERFLKPRIMTEIGPSLNTSQYGGLKGRSVDQYAASLTSDLCASLEDDYLSVVIAMDQSSAFNTLKPSEVVEAARTLGLSNPMLRILISYLHKRHTVVNYNGIRSAPRWTKGGSGQGTIWSVTLFLVAVNGLINKVEGVMRRMEEPGTKHPSRMYQYVDDSLLVLNFRKDKLPPIVRKRKKVKTVQIGLAFSDPTNRVQAALQAVVNFCSKSGLRLNPSKTEAIVIDRASKGEKQHVYFQHGDLAFRDKIDRNGKVTPGDIIKPSEKAIRVIGYQIDSRLKFQDLVKHRVKSATVALWQLQRLRDWGLSKDTLGKCYQSFVRSRLEFGVPAILCRLTKTLTAELERVQRRATRLILNSDFCRVKELEQDETQNPDFSDGYGPNPRYVPYKERCERLSLMSILDRQKQMEAKLANKLQNDRSFERHLPKRQRQHQMQVRGQNEDTYQLPSGNVSNYLRNSPSTRFMNILNDKIKRGREEQHTADLFNELPM